MPLSGYGLLIGTVVGSQPQHGGNPHWLLMVQTKNAGHPLFRVAVNLQSSVKTGDPQIQFQDIDVNRDGRSGLKALTAAIEQIGATDSFLTASDHPTLPSLDFVRGDILDNQSFQDIPEDADPFRDAFQAALSQATESNCPVAVFGAGYPVNKLTGRAEPTGFQGVDNIHMNQGSFQITGGSDHYLENGPKQDGGLIFLLPSGPRALFVKFHSQTLNTDDNGNPAETGIAELDRTAADIRNVLLTPTVALQPAGEAPIFIFADRHPEDADRPFIEDNDAATFKSPFVMQYSTGQTRGPVPTPRRYPTLELTDVTGQNPQGYTKNESLEQIVFDLLGDSGAPAGSNLATEESVTALLSCNAQHLPPAFLFHLGDVVYYYGEKDYYYSQFYEPFRTYPAPIFAIPGNHDGVTYDTDMVSLDAFQKAFCAVSPGRWEGAGGILRSTMIQPGVYFTLNAPLVSIIGLYSNCSESIGWLDEQQLLFLYHELKRLKELRQTEGRAVLLAIHHCPRWFPDEAATDQASAAFDRTFQQAGFWPDAVLCGHAHLYQRIVRQIDRRDIPYLIAGAGGYGIDAQQELAKEYTRNLDPKLNCLILEEGYLRAIVTKPSATDRNPSIRFEYHSINNSDANSPKDVIEIDLITNKML